jgi:hypothetical protein
MQWFKHDSDAMSDPRIKKLIIRFGATGYAIYFHCLELLTVSGNIKNTETLIPVIIENLYIKGTQEKSAREIVKEILAYLIGSGLLEATR